MPRLTRTVLVLTTLILLSFAAPAASAATLIIGSNNDLSRYPFGRDPGNASSSFPDFAAGGVYQQVYAGSAFSGPVIITQIAFASKGQLTSGPGTATYNFNVALSTTAAAPNGLSTNLAANRGADFAQVFSGPLTSTITANNQFDLVIDIAPFAYDPAQGNLLLDVTFNSPTQFTGGSVLYFNAGFSSGASRAANPSGNTGGAFTDGFSIQTRFTTKAAAQLTLGNRAQTFDGSPKSVAVATDPPGLGVVVTYDGSATPPSNAGSYAVVVTINDPDFIGQASGNLLVNKAGQQITFDPLPNRTLADPDFNVSASASSNLAVSFSANGNCTLTGAQAHLTGAGSCAITASQGGSGNYDPAPDVAQSFNVSKADQTISFGALSPKTFGDPDFTASATSASGLPLSFTASGQCAVTASTVHLNGAGSCTITASQSGDATYNAAPDVAQSFNIGKAGSTTTVTVKGATYDGLTHGGTANATGAGNLSQSLTVVYSGRNGTTYGPSKTAPADAGDYTAAASFDGDESHEASNDTKDFNIAEATAAITLGDLNQTYTGTARNATASTNPSGLSGITISYSRNAAPVASPVNSGSYEVLASLTNSNYQADNAAGTLVIDKATATITLTDLAHTYDGSAKAASATTDPAGRNVSISYSLSGQTIATPTNAGSYLVTAKIDDANYQGSATATLVIERAAPVITWASPVDITFGTALGNAQLNATASVAGAFAYTPAAGTALNAGAGQTLSVNFTPTDAANYNTVSKSVLINVSKATPEITWSSPANITFGTALGAAQLNATANAAGAFTYTPAAGTVLNAGNSQSLSVSFVPTDTNNNNAATKSVSINVLKADQTITFNALANKIFGDAPFNLSATSTSGQTVSFSIVLGPATLSGDQLTIKGIGHVIVRASLIGDSNHNAAPAVDRAFDVTTASATIALSNLLQTFDGTAKAPTVVTTPAGLSFNLTYSRNGQAVASPTGAGNYNVTATVTDPNYQGSANAILVVNKATPTLAWNAPANIASGTALSATQLNATANVAGAFTYDPPLGTILSVGLNQLSVTFIPTDSANFTNASQTVQLTVEQLTSNEINLSQSIYNASEADGHVTITVNRTGDTTGAAAIEYATPDTAGLQNCSVLNGVALQRCDYAMTTGTLRFAPGETSKTIDIALVDDSYAEGPESFTITLSNPVGEGLGTVSTATVTVADNEATNGVNPVADPAFFVRQHYMDFLNREPDPQGFADWLNVLNNCPQGSITCDRIEVSSGFFRSPEFRERGYFPYRFYVVSLGRKPNFAEFMPDLARVSGFLTEAEKEQARRDFIAGFMSRAEFTTIYNGLSDLAYVQRLFDTAGVTQVTVNGSVQTVETMLQQLASGKSRAQVLREMVESTEVDAKFFNEAFVVMQYFGYLRRDPDALFTQWIETLDRTGDYRTMINGFINSDEYVQRFGP